MLEVEVAVHKVEHKSHGMKEILDLQVSNGWFGAVTFLHTIIIATMFFLKRSFVQKSQKWVTKLTLRQANR